MITTAPEPPAYAAIRQVCACAEAALPFRISNTTLVMEPVGFQAAGVDLWWTYGRAHHIGLIPACLAALQAAGYTAREERHPAGHGMYRITKDMST